MDQIDQILEKTDGGLKVFQEYLGSTVKPGVKFKNPSMTIPLPAAIFITARNAAGTSLWILATVPFVATVSGLWPDGRIWTLVMTLMKYYV